MVRALTKIICLVMVGCGGVGDVTTPPPPLTLQPLPTSFVFGECHQTSNFETWLQFVTSRQSSFAELVEGTADKSREAAFEDVRQMNQVLHGLLEHGVIDCGEEAFDLLLSAMQTTLTEFQDYVNNDGNINAIIQNARTTFIPVNAAFDELIAQLEAQYQR